MSTTKVFDSKDVKVKVDGTIITGFGEGTFVKCEKNEDSIKPYVGAQGEVSFGETNDPTGKITVTIQNTSASYSFLMEQADVKDVYPTYVIDRNSGLTYGGTECRIMKPSDAEFSNEVTTREFVIYVADYAVE